MGAVAVNSDFTESAQMQALRALNAELEVRIEACTRELTENKRAVEAHTQALERFAELARRQASDSLTLIRQIQEAVTELIGEGFAVYYELDGNVWQLKSQVGSPEDATIQASLESALPYETVRNFRIPWESGAPLYLDAYDPALDHGVPGTEALASTAALPVLMGLHRQGIFGYGLRVSRAWTRADRVTLETAVLSLGLALERAEQTARQERQTAELSARTRALEGFANLTRDLSMEADPYVLVRRAQEVALSLLPEGYALYFEPGGERWVLRGQTGDLRSEALQAVADAGLPYDEANNLLIPYHSLNPYYQDQYARDTDNLDELVDHLGASATLPVLVNGKAQGVFAVVLFGGTRHWTRPDQAALESVVRSLGLALERARSVAELAARTQEVGTWRERYEVAVRGSGALLYDWDPATDAIVYGGAVEQITGYTPEELDGNLADWTGRLIHPDDRETFTQEIARVIASGDEAHVSFRLLRKDGSVRTVEDDGYFRRDPQGEVTRMVGFVRDVTERRQAEQDLARSNEELRRSNAELEQFAYIASHDLQAPIRVVTSFAGVIDRRYGTQLDERGRLYLRQIVDNGEHMKRLVDDLLAFSRVHTERRELLPVDTEQVFDTVASRLQTPGVIVVRGDLPVVWADAQQLDQLLQNLISNGLKYRREGVTPHIHISAHQEGELWRFAVSDNGIGIEPQYYERIFVIFQRLHGRETYEGTGIGLAVCKKIVERHGGQLWLESTPGQGSTFFFTLPAA